MEITYDDDVFVGYRYYLSKDVETSFPFGYGLRTANFYPSIVIRSFPTPCFAGY